MFFAIAKRYNNPFSLAVVDVNGLKEINDTYGHLAGDAVLKEFASIAKGVLRQSDIIFRYGGDEFTIILPGVDEEAASFAMKLCSRCRALVQKCVRCCRLWIPR